MACRQQGKGWGGATASKGGALWAVEEDLKRTWGGGHARVREGA